MRPLVHGAESPLSVLLPAPPGGEADALLVRVAPSPVVDVKLNGYKEEGVEGAFFPGVSGYLGIDATALADGTLVARLPSSWLPAGRSSIHILDSDGADAGRAFELDIPDEVLDGSTGRTLSRRDARGSWDLVQSKPTGHHRRLTLTAREGAGRIDRLQVRQSNPWVIPLR